MKTEMKPEVGSRKSEVGRMAGLLLLISVLCPLTSAFSQPPPTSSTKPVYADALNNWLPAAVNGHVPNLPAGTTLGGATIAIGSALPTQTGHNGEYLTTNGTAASWAAIPPPSDTAFGSSWNGVLTIAPSKNAVYDIIHAFDTDDDGKVNVLDQAAGIPLTDANGVLLTPLGLDTDETLAANSDSKVATQKAVRTYVDAHSGGSTWVAKTTTYTAVSGDLLLANTSGGAFTITLPASPSVGAVVSIVDAQGTFATNNLTVGRNSQSIGGSASNMTASTNNAAFQLIFVGSSMGWQVVRYQ